MKTIVQDIQIHMKEEEELESIIQQEYEPEIAVSASRMENEPVVVLETPDTLPTEMTANEMKIIMWVNFPIFSSFF